MRERTFIRNDVVMSTRVPAAATRLLAEGWRELQDGEEIPVPALPDPEPIRASRRRRAPRITDAE